VRLFTAPADIARLEADLRQDLTTLYEMLLAKPLAGLDPQVQHLQIVPGAGLHAVPLGALYDGRRHLIERYTLNYLPAASLLTTLPRRQPNTARRALILAYDDTAHLPGVVEEGEQVKQALANLKEAPLLLQGEAATRTALREHTSTCDVLHVAAHGRFRTDAPLFSGVQLADVPLTAHEIYDLDLSRVALVTLSACQTGLAQGRGGELLGLTQACFFAGAPTVVVSRWRVDDATTVQLMVDFYAGLTAGQPAAEALRDAQRNLLATHPHAGYWAPFAIWGRGETKLV
jgi:CHAT domain-containing protein